MLSRISLTWYVKIVFSWAYEPIHNKTDPQQNGNISSSTTHCLISLLNFIYQSHESRKTSVLASIVFRIASDLIDRSTFIRRTLTTGIPSHLTAWLGLPHQRTPGHSLSESHVNKATNDLRHASRDTKGPSTFLNVNRWRTSWRPHYWKYVDDSKVSFTIDKTAPDHSTFQNILQQLQSWTELNHVTINIRKALQYLSHCH